MDSTTTSEASAWAEAAGSLAHVIPLIISSTYPPLDFKSCSWEDDDSSPDELCFMQWNFDAIELERLSDAKPIQFVTEQIFTHNTDMVAEFKGCVKIFRRIFVECDASYNPWASSEGRVVNFHTATHGADVTQALFFLLQGPPGILTKLVPAIELSNQKVSLVKLAAIFASAMHDYDHPGFTNEFVAKSNHALLKEFGKSSSDSILEKFHCSRSFALLEQAGFGDHLSKKDFFFFKSIVTDMVLATDIGHHFELMNRPVRVEDFRECLCLLLHAADVSNVARPPQISRQWGERVVEEFFSQGDLERQLSLAVTPMMDRESAHVGRVQAGFIEVIARPLFAKLINELFIVDDENTRFMQELELNWEICLFFQ